MNESLSTHLELSGFILSAIGLIVIPIWLSIRKEARREREIFQEETRRERELSQKRHEDNIRIITEIKTLVTLQVAPMYAWWIKKIGNGAGEE